MGKKVIVCAHCGASHGFPANTILAVIIKSPLGRQASWDIRLCFSPSFATFLLP